MFKKLLKYELQYFYKYLGILYLVIFGFALVTRLIHGLSESINLGPFVPMIYGVFVGCIIGVLVNNISRVWLRFRNNIFGDEGYLTNTLPIPKSQIYLSKCVAAIITLSSSILVGAITFFIAYYDGRNAFSFWIEKVATVLTTSPQSWIVVLACLLELICLIKIGYLGIILGHRANKAKKFRSIIYSMLIFLLLQLVTVLVVLLTDWLAPDSSSLSLFSNGQQSAFETVETILMVGVFNYLIYIVVLYFASVKLLDRGINLE